VQEKAARQSTVLETQTSKQNSEQETKQYKNKQTHTHHSSVPLMRSRYVGRSSIAHVWMSSEDHACTRNRQSDSPCAFKLACISFRERAGQLGRERRERERKRERERENKREKEREKPKKESWLNPRRQAPPICRRGKPQAQTSGQREREKEREREREKQTSTEREIQKDREMQR
jgi:hypothetical protein